MMKIPRIKPAVRFKPNYGNPKVPYYEVKGPSYTALNQKKPRRFTAMRKAGRKYRDELKTTVTQTLKKEVEKKAAELDVNGLVGLAQKTAEMLKTPVGTSGRNFNIMKLQLLDQPAVGGTTESTSLFSYRPKRASKTTDTIRYEAIRNKKATFTNNDGKQALGDRNLAVLVPPLGDDMDSNESWTNFAIQNEFDRMLRARTVNDNIAIDALKQTLVANYHSLSSVMIIKAPSEGAIVEIYDLQPKFGIGGSDSTSAGAGEKYSIGHMSPTWCWVNGYDNAIIETNDDYDEFIVNSEPLESPTFRRTWNIIKKTTVRMTSNSIHRHRFVFNINKSVTYDEMSQSSVEGGTAPWLPCQLIVSRGYPTASSLAAPVSVEVQQESKLTYSSRLAKTSDVIVYNNNT